MPSDHIISFSWSLLASHTARHVDGAAILAFSSAFQALISSATAREDLGRRLVVADQLAASGL